MNFFILLFISMVLVLGVPAGIVILIVLLADPGNKENAVPQQNAANAGVGINSALQQKAAVQPEPPKPPRPPREKMNLSAVMMLIGTAFIILAAITFVAANWVKMQPEGRVFALAGAAVLAFTISAVVKAAVKLEVTSIAFYTIGSAVSAVTLITAANYELFGNWFCIDGGGAPLVFASASAIIAVSSFAAYAIYKKAFFNYFGFSFVSVLLICVCAQLTDNYEQFAPLIVLVQMVITAAIHVIKPQKDTIMEKPALIVGDITAVLFDILGFLYVLGTTVEPTAYTFAVLIVIMAQLLIYGILKKQSWMYIFLNILAVYTALVASIKIENELGKGSVALLFAIITLVIYLVNLAAPKNHPAAKVIAFFTAILGSIVSLCAGNERLYGLNLIVPLTMSAVITLYAFHKEKAVQVTAGVFAPFLPFFSALYLNGRLNWEFPLVDYKDIAACTYGGLVLLYIAVSALCLLLPKIAFSVHAKHPMQTQTILYANMVAAAAVLFNICGYSQVFLAVAVLCIMHFAVSNMLRCNLTAAGSVISLIMLTSGVLEHYFSSDDRIAMYSMFGLFVVMIIVSRFVFSQSFALSKDGKTTVDVILLGSWITIFTYPAFDRTANFLRLISLAVFIAGFIKKRTGGDTAAILLSFSSFLAAMAALSRPFLNPESSMINSKITLGIFLMLGVAYKFIWKNHRTASKLVSTIIFVLSFTGLIIDGIIYSNVMNRIFVLAVTAAVLISSFYAKSKTWFAASSIALVVITVFSTIGYFDKMGWWIYLFVVGVVLVVIAAVNEACRKKGESVKSTVSKKFSDWTW